MNNEPAEEEVKIMEEARGLMLGLFVIGLVLGSVVLAWHFYNK